MSKTSSNILMLAICLVCLAIIGGVVYRLAFSPERVEVPIGGPFTLQDHNGEAVSEATYAGQHKLIYFGYTYCPDVCPTELAEMSAALDLLEEREPAIAKQIKPIFITVDPARDTVEVMNSYREAFHPRMAALTGSEAEIRAAAKTYRVFFSKVQPTDDMAEDEYLMDHSSIIYFMDEDNRYLNHFSAGTGAEQMAKVILDFLD